MKKIIFIIIFFSLGIAGYSNENTKIEDRINEIEYRVGILESIKEYNDLEKEILKEIYYSNIKAINVGIAIALAIISIIGIIGVRSINEIKKDFQSELETLRNIRQETEKELSNIKSSQNKLDDNYKNIKEQYEEQNRKIRILELQEKIQNLMKNKNFQRALEYCAIAYEMDSKNTIIIRFYAYCYLKIGDYTNSIRLYEKLNKLEPNEETASTNLMELYLLDNKITKFEKWFEEHEHIIRKRNDEKYLLNYFNVLKKYKSNEDIYQSVKEILDNIEEKNEKKVYVNWDFYDVKKYINSDEETENKNIFNLFIMVLSGEITATNGLEKLAKYNGL